MTVMDASRKYPMSTPDGAPVKQIVYLKNVIDHPRMEIGDFSYYHNFTELGDYASALAPYLFPQSPDKLIIGKFAQIAHGVQFITDSANHEMKGFSTYPFQNFMPVDNGTGSSFSKSVTKADIVIGHDVWIGMNATIMPGVTIGNGAIIGACSVVTKDIPSYTVAGGNPAGLIRKRFADEIIEELESIRWWDWTQDRIEQNLAAIQNNNIDALRVCL